MLYEIAIPILPLDSINRAIKSTHWPVFNEVQHTYICNRCKCIFPCVDVRIAATALHYAEELASYEEKKEARDDEFDADMYYSTKD
jgi:hypothetical protein